ncbi:MAG: hypothetical protein FWE36_08705 [Erysipelotrichales bacterium]|nr:hypothetical protein [Erysipelotrichales bacterium]
MSKSFYMSSNIIKIFFLAFSCLMIVLSVIIIGFSDEGQNMIFPYVILIPLSTFSLISTFWMFRNRIIINKNKKTIKIIGVRTKVITFENVKSISYLTYSEHKYYCNFKFCLRDDSVIIRPPYLSFSKKNQKHRTKEIVEGIANGINIELQFIVEK